MTEPSRERIERAARVLASNLSHSDPDRVNKYAAKPRPEWMFFERTAKAALTADDSALSHRITELEAQLAAERKLGDEMAEALKNMLQYIDQDNLTMQSKHRQWNEILAHYSEERGK